VDVDEARLMPHLRIRARRAKAEVYTDDLAGAVEAKSWRRLPVDPLGLRGVPVVGVPGAGGAIRGSRPGDSLLRGC
jgi:hypothetical protein